MRAYWEWKDAIGDTLVMMAVVVVALLGCFILFVAAPRMAWVKSQCLAMGYAESDVDWKLTAYCVQRDYRGVMKAIPLEELR